MKREIHFENSNAFNFLSDRKFMQLLTDTMGRCKHTLNIYGLGENKASAMNIKKLITYRKSWIKLALKDTLLTELQKKYIKELDRFKQRKESNLWSDLGRDLKPAFDYLIILQKEKMILKGRRDNGKETARYFLLEALRKWHPGISSIDENEIEGLEERLKKHLS